VRVSRRPKVAIISTGDEVQVPGKARRPGQIYDANGYSLLGLALRRGADARFLGIARDRPNALKKKIGEAQNADVVVMTGGVSVGDYDFAAGLLAELGFREIFYKVRVQPGMPTFAGIKGRQLVFGLPGNPVSCMVCFELFARPALEKMMGLARPGMSRGRAFLAADLKVRPGRRKFLRGSLVGSGPEFRVQACRDQKSGVLRSMVEADALIEVPEEVAELKAGSVVDVWRLGEDR
jgi:molybdopterin molybdotransferase